MVTIVLETCFKNLKTLLTLTAANQFTDLVDQDNRKKEEVKEKEDKETRRRVYSRDEHIHGSDCLFIVVESHIEGLESLRVVINHRGALIVLLGEKSLVFRAKIDAPIREFSEFTAVLDFLLQNLNGL